MALGKDWHKICFTCSNDQCNKRLNAGEQLEVGYSILNYLVFSAFLLLHGIYYQHI